MQEVLQEVIQPGRTAEQLPEPIREALPGHPREKELEALPGHPREKELEAVLEHQPERQQEVVPERRQEAVPEMQHQPIAARIICLLCQNFCQHYLVEVIKIKTKRTELYKFSME